MLRLKGLLRSFTLSSMATAFTEPAKAAVRAAGLYPHVLLSWPSAAKRAVAVTARANRGTMTGCGALPLFGMVEIFRAEHTAIPVGTPSRCATAVATIAAKNRCREGLCPRPAKAPAETSEYQRAVRGSEAQYQRQ